MRRSQKLGQHFLNAPWAAKALAESLSIRAQETVLEIGPGKGALTKELLNHSTHIVAIEKDPVLIPVLEEAFAAELSSGTLRIIEEDIRSIEPRQLGLSTGGYVVAANIPYYITGEIIRKFLETTTQPRAMALLIQKEVAERIVARDHKESLLSLSVKAYGTPSIVAKVGRTCFNPPPAVDSAILRVDSIQREFFSTISERAFFSVLHAGFASKRKQLGGNLERAFGERAAQALQEAGVDPRTRAEDLTLAQWKSLTERLV